MDSGFTRPDRDKTYHGLFRGTVLNNVDPEMRGRIMAIVPDVSGPYPTGWALPCLAGTGLNSGVFTVPLIGSGVWMMFEGGDPDYPVWMGGFWGSVAERPVLSQMVPPGVPGITLQTATGNGIVISDVPGTGGILIQSRLGASILVNDVGIVIQNGKGASVALTGPSVAINLTALTVT
jgi:hypothetical protein